MAFKPNPKTKRAADYEERSARVAKEIEKIELKSRNDARQLIANTLVDSVNTLTELMESGKPELRLPAAKHLLKLGGLEIDQVAGKDGAPILVKIHEDHANKIREAAAR